MPAYRRKTASRTIDRLTGTRKSGGIALRRAPSRAGTRVTTATRATPSAPQAVPPATS